MDVCIVLGKFLKLYLMWGRDRMSLFKWAVAVTLVGLSLVGSSIANAATITYSFTVDSCTGTCGTGPFGTVKLTDVSSGVVDVLVTLSPGERFVKTGAGDAFTFDLLGNPTIAVSNLTAGFTLLGTPTPGTPGSTGPNGALGHFEYGFACSGCGNGGSPPHIFGPLSFRVTATGISIASFNDPNSGGNLFSADIMGANGNTGVVAAKSTPSAIDVPVPGPLAGAGLPGLLMALGGIVAWRRRRAVHSA